MTAEELSARIASTSGSSSRSSATVLRLSTFSLSSRRCVRLLFGTITRFDHSPGTLPVRLPTSLKQILPWCCGNRSVNICTVRTPCQQCGLLQCTVTAQYWTSVVHIPVRCIYRGCKRPASAEAERPPLAAVAMNGSPITRSGRVRRSTGSAQQRGQQSSQQRQRQEQQEQQQQQQREQQQRAVRPRTRLQTAGGGAGRSCLGPQEPGPSAEVAGPPAGVDRCVAA